MIINRVQLLADIESFLKRTGIKEDDFAENYLHYKSFITRLRCKSFIGEKELRRVYHVINQYNETKGSAPITRDKNSPTFLLLRQIESFIKRTNVSATQLSFTVFGYNSFISSLRKGIIPTQISQEKMLSFINNYTGAPLLSSCIVKPKNKLIKLPEYPQKKALSPELAKARQAYIEICNMLEKYPRRVQLQMQHREAAQVYFPLARAWIAKGYSLHD